MVEGCVVGDWVVGGCVVGGCVFGGRVVLTDVAVEDCVDVLIGFCVGAALK